MTESASAKRAKNGRNLKYVMSMATARGEQWLVAVDLDVVGRGNGAGGGAAGYREAHPAGRRGEGIRGVGADVGVRRAVDRGGEIDAVEGGLDLVAVGPHGAVEPIDVDLGKRARGAEVGHPPLRIGGAGGRPAGIGIAVVREGGGQAGLG